MTGTKQSQLTCFFPNASKPFAAPSKPAAKRKEASATPATGSATGNARHHKDVQLHLDAGQRSIGHITCRTCGMVYVPGSSEDEELHRQHHAAVTAENSTSALRFQGWSNERCLVQLGDAGRLLMVLPSDPAPHVKKVQELCAFLERIMGLEPGWVQGCTNSSGAAASTAMQKHDKRSKQSGQQRQSQQHRTLLLVTPTKQVAGIAVVEPAQQAHPGVCESQGCSDPGSSSRGGRAGKPGSSSPAQAGSSAQGQADVGDASGSALAQARGKGVRPGVVPDTLPASSGHCSRTQTSSQAFTSIQVTGKHTPALEVAQSGHHHQVSVSDNSLGQDTSTQPPKRPRVDAVTCGPTSGGSSKPSGTQTALPSTAGRSSGRGTATVTTLPLLSPDTSTTVRCQLGVRAVWVSPKLCRQGLATQILDIARCHLIPGYVVPRDQVAFAHTPLLQPEASAFALAYSCGSSAAGEQAGHAALVYGD